MFNQIAPNIFRVLNTTWAALVTALFAIALDEPSPPVIAGTAFWGIYLLVSIGTLFESRIAWAVCIVQLIGIWVLMGLVVSDGTFVFFTGRSLGTEPAHDINSLVFNTFFGVLVPASVMIILLVLSVSHVVWVLSGRAARTAPQVIRSYRPYDMRREQGTGRRVR
jgi:hypothetical protein